MGIVGPGGTCRGLKGMMGRPGDCGTWWDLTGIEGHNGTSWGLWDIAGLAGDCRTQWDFVGITGHGGTCWDTAGLIRTYGTERDCGTYALTWGLQCDIT